jgi:integrase
MAIEERNGKFRAQVMIDGKRHNDTFDTLQAAKDWIEDQKRKGRRNDGVVQMPSRDSLASVIDAYCKEDGDWSRDKDDHLKKLKADLGHLALSRLTKPVIYDYIKAWKASPGNANSRISYLSSALQYAKHELHLCVRMDQFLEAREALCLRGLIGTSNARTRRPTEGELQELAAAFTGGDRAVDLPAILEILSLLPIRVGELCGIEWRDINHEKRTVLLRSRKHPDPKVKKMNDEVIPLYKVKGIDTYDLLVTNRQRFGNQEGPFPYRVQAVSNAMIQVRDNQTKIKDLHVHDLRAHAISAMLEAGVEPMMVMMISGHKNPTTFYKRYVRLDIEKVRKDMEKKMIA